MAVLELYGKCKELGYCDCGGFLGCTDPDRIGNRPSPDELDAARRAAGSEVMSEAKRKYAANEPLVELIDCTICDRSHAPNHHHIQNVDGDELIDDGPAQRMPAPVISLPPPDDQLPEWLRDKPAADATEDSDKPQELCQVCDEPWAPRHECIGAPVPTFNAKIEPPKGRTGGRRDERKCDVCGKVKRRNHNCKGHEQIGPPVEAAKPCEHCEVMGELCVRHGGTRSDYDTLKGGEQVAQELPQPTPVTMPADSVMESERTHNCRKGHPRTPENTYIRADGRRECKEYKRQYQSTGRPALQAEADPELAAIGTSPRAVDGLASNQLKRVMSYVAARIEETAS